MSININWFKNKFSPFIEQNYNTEYLFFKDSDFGDIERVEFEGYDKGGTIDFWSTGYLSIHIVDYLKKEEIINVFLEPNQMEEKEKYLEQMYEIIKL
jgi:hypothetical protein